MRIFALVLLIVLLLLQYRLWFSDSGVREVRRLEQAVAAQREENATLEARNEQLAAEVKDLKEGLEAVEERARSDLGMVGANESFYQVVTPDPAAPTDPPVSSSVAKQPGAAEASAR
jgi:cell division protein FtsB